MVISLVLACQARTPVPNSIRGLAVIAVEPIPAQPSGVESLRLRTWVADGLGRGADVMVWLCTPYEGRCVEPFALGGTGLPLSIWTRTGTLDGVNFTSDVAWPFFASIAASQLSAESAGTLTIGALACAPGVCPIIDQVRANPVSGSEAWEAAAHALANPQDWLEELPPGQVSLAVKQVPLYVEDQPPFTTPYAPTFTYGTSSGPNHAPTLIERAQADSGATSDLVDRFLVYDPDGDELSIRPFTTAGGAVMAPGTDTGLSVMWQEPVSPLHEPVKFVVVEDGRGGTAVWTDAAEARCGDVSLASSKADGTGLTMDHIGSSVVVYLDYLAEGPTPDELSVVIRDDETNTALGGASGGGSFNAALCETTFSDVPVFLGGPSICSLGGKPVTVEARFGDETVAESHFVLKLPPDEPCTE